MSRIGDDDWRAVIDTNLGGTFHVCKAASRKMLRKRRGAIVTMSSVVGMHGNAGQTNYAASKGGVIALTKALAKEVGSRGIRVNCIAPGYIATELTDVLPEAARGRNPRPDAAGAAWRPRRRRACRTVPPLGRRRLHHGRGRTGRRRNGDVAWNGGGSWSPESAP